MDSLYYDSKFDKLLETTTNTIVITVITNKALVFI